MRMSSISLIASVGLSLTAALPALAHHSFAAEFDANKPVTIEGTVKEFRWVNPHSWLHINVTKPDGTVEEWAVEGGAPSALLRRGWTRDTLPPGTKVVVEGFGWVYLVMILDRYTKEMGGTTRVCGAARGTGWPHRTG